MHKRLALAVLAAAAPLPALAQESPARDNIDALIEAHAKAQGIPASLVHRVVKRESNYNPRARGHGGALGLMQIKHGTARGMGYNGSPAGLLDARVNLTYGVAYLAGAYRTARGNEAQAYSYYARGYYYDAKRAGVRTEIAELEPAPRPSATGLFGRLFGGAPQAPTVATATADPGALALSNAVSAEAPGAASAEPVVYTVPLPPARPVFAALDAAPLEAQPATTVVAAAEDAAPVVTVPLPPARPDFAPVATAAFPATLPAQALAFAPAPAAAPFPAPAAAATAANATPAAAPATPAAAPPETAEAAATPLPPRRPTEFRHFALRKPALPALSQTAAALPEAVGTAKP